MSTFWISDPRGVKLRRRRVPRGLPFWKESPLMDPGREAETTVTEAGESEGNPSHAELNLQDDQLRLRGGQVRGRRRGIRVTSLAEVVVDGGGVGEEDDDTFTVAPPRRMECRGGRAWIWGPLTSAVDMA